MLLTMIGCHNPNFWTAILPQSYNLIIDEKDAIGGNRATNILTPKKYNILKESSFSKNGKTAS